MKHNYFSAELRVGKVVRVAGTSARVIISFSPEALATHLKISRGSYLVIDTGANPNIVQVVELSGEQGVANGEERRFADVDFLLSLNSKSGDIVPGIKSYPHLGDAVYAVTQSTLDMVAMYVGNTKVGSMAYTLARQIDAKGTPISLTPETLFGRHLAIIGASGGGKSWTVARVVEETSRNSSKVILIDATGEFAGLGGDISHIHIGMPPEPRPNSLEVVLPYYELLESDLFAILQPSGDVQAPKLRAAIRTLKLLEIEQHLSLNGTMMKANRHKQQYQEAYYRHLRELESPTATFDVARLAEQLKYECVSDIRSATETDYWGNYNEHEESMVFPLIARVNDALHSGALEPIFHPDERHSLYSVLEWFLASPELRTLVVSLENLSFQLRAREIVANALGRQLMMYARKGHFRTKPVLLMVDEAHQFLNSTLESKAQDYPLDSFAIVAKEGRKYALNICIATQRPCDIPESVLSQIGTLIVHRLTNDRDRSIVERACGEMDNGTMKALPVLAPGQAVILGIDLPIPLRVEVERPVFPPFSRGPDFQTFWR